MKCPYCNNDIDMNDKFCPYCYSEIDIDKNHDLKVQVLREKYMKNSKPNKNENKKSEFNVPLIPIGLLGLIISAKKVFQGQKSFYNLFVFVLSFSLILAGFKKKKRKG